METFKFVTIIILAIEVILAITVPVYLIWRFENDRYKQKKP